MHTMWAKNVTLLKGAWNKASGGLDALVFLDDTWGDGTIVDYPSEDWESINIPDLGPQVDDWDFYGGNPCSSDADCAGVCPPDLPTSCYTE